MVTRLNHLARSARDVLNILSTIAEKGAGLRSLGDTWVDTTPAHRRLMLTLLGGLAEFERELIRARTTDVRVRAGAARFSGDHSNTGQPKERGGMLGSRSRFLIKGCRP
jgi:DNA invertase Pin-like site-specific DNA recombinase